MAISDESVTAIELVDPLVGTIFDKRFRVDERLAAGGFGAIYKATHVKSGHEIALKVLHPTLASDIGVLARFRREGTTLTSLRNPHTITAYEYGQADKTLFIVLELLHGESLFEHYSVSGPMEWRRVVHIATQVCESLEEAHAQGIVHRDLKPTNIHLEEVGGDPDYVKVLDFGIAKIVRGSEHDSQDITNAGQMIGTLDYMSPEQMVGGQVTGQTDIYTLGILMYEMIAGTRPFPESTTATGALAAMLKTTPEPLYLRAPVPRDLDAVVMKCLERETQKRFRSVGELRAELERAVGHAAPGGTATVMVPKRVFENTGDDETTVTPPPEKILDALRTATKRPSGPALDSARTPKLDIALAKTDLARVPIVDDDADPSTDDVRRTPRVEITARPDVARTPRIERHTPTLEAMNTPRVERKPVPQWDDDDERAATTTRRPDGYDETPSARAKVPERPPVRPFESRHVATPVPQVVVAPFSHRTPPPVDPRQSPSGQMPPHDRPRTPSGQMAPFPTTPGYSYPAGQTPAPGAFPQIPATPIPHPIPTTPGMFEAQAPFGGARPPTAAYDMGKIAARDAAIRRLVWIIVLAVAASVGFIIATQL